MIVYVQTIKRRAKIASGVSSGVGSGGFALEIPKAEPNSLFRENTPVTT
jgi:hypothetical protein